MLIIRQGINSFIINNLELDSFYLVCYIRYRRRVVVEDADGDNGWVR